MPTNDPRRRLALPNTEVFEKYIASRAEKKKELKITLTTGEEVQGFSIGLDEDWLQVVDIDTEKFRLLFVPNIIGFQDGRRFWQLDDAQKELVDQRTALFRSACIAYLQEAWGSESLGRGTGGPSSKGQGRGSFGSERPGYGRTRSSGVQSGDVQGNVRVPSSSRWNTGTSSPTKDEQAVQI